MNIVNKIDIKLEIDNILINRGRKEYNIKEFMELSSPMMEGVSLALANYERVMQDINGKNIGDLSDSYIDSRVKMIENIIENLLKYRETIVNARLESKYTTFKQAIIEFFSAVLAQIANSVKSWSSIIESDGKLVDKDFQTELNFSKF